MKGYILLEGGAEFQGQMAAPDRRAMELAGGMDAPVAIIPTAAAPDQNHRRAGNNGVRWFQSLGARQVRALELIDRASANRTSVWRRPSGPRAWCTCWAGLPITWGRPWRAACAWRPCEMPTGTGR